MQFLRQTLLVIAAASLVGSEPLSAGEEVTVGSEIPRHERHSPARRKALQGASEETRTLDPSPKPWREWEHATGEWRDTRPWLDERGVIPEATYTGEVFSNLRGGIKTGTRYRGNVDVTVTLDSEKLGLWSDGMFFLYFQNGHGEGITKKLVGDIQVLSNLDALDFTQVSEYWFGQRLFQERLRLKVGKQDASIDFGALDYGGDFINSSFGVNPTVPMPSFPDPALGAAAFIDPTEWMTMGVGAYDGDAYGRTSGFDTLFDGVGGGFGIFELGLRTSLVSRAWKPGTYRVGTWYHSGDVEEISDAPSPEIFSGNHGFYLAFDQLLLQEHDHPEDEQGIGAFAQFGWAPGDRNKLEYYVGGGLAYMGAISTRDEDVLGLGVAYVQFSDRVRRLEGLTDETVVEFFYKAQLTSWLSLQPDVQFISNPGGDGEDALAVGLRFVIDL